MIDENKRIKAVDTALYGNHLLTEKYFSRASAALNNKKKEDFYAVCNDAGIPKEIQEKLYDALGDIIDRHGIW